MINICMQVTSPYRLSRLHSKLRSEISKLEFTEVKIHSIKGVVINDKKNKDG